MRNSDESLSPRRSADRISVSVILGVSFISFVIAVSACRFDSKPERVSAHSESGDFKSASSRSTDSDSKTRAQGLALRDTVDTAGIRDLTQSRPYAKLGDGTWTLNSKLPLVTESRVRFDLDWLSAADLEQRARGLFPCGDFWFSEADANDYHSRLGRWWRIPGRKTWIYSTCSREVSLNALREADRTVESIEARFDRPSSMPPTLILLRSLVQYNAFGVTRPSSRLTAPEVSGLSGIHYAYLCESWIDLSPGREPDYPGAACAYWDQAALHGAAWGALAVRHAAVQAYLESIDPSPLAVRKLLAATNHEFEFDAKAFWSEKRIPLWLRYGLAIYYERFAADEREPDPLRLRKWSREVIRESGGIGELKVIFDPELSAFEPERSAARILRAGHLVSFLLEGEDSGGKKILQDLIQDRRGVRASALEAWLLTRQSTIAEH